MGTIAVNDSNFDSVVLQSETPVLVDFWAEWCGPCRMLAPVIDGLSVAFADKLKVVKLDTDENQATASNYEISGIPCCILFKNGEEVTRFVGYRPQGAFESELTKYLG
ncbi:thioredoxin [bacterium]|nr:thioredoxin [bacterium]